MKNSLPSPIQCKCEIKAFNIAENLMSRFSHSKLLAASSSEKREDFGSSAARPTRGSGCPPTTGPKTTPSWFSPPPSLRPETLRPHPPPSGPPRAPRPRPPVARIAPPPRTPPRLCPTTPGSSGLGTLWPRPPPSGQRRAPSLGPQEEQIALPPQTQPWLCSAAPSLARLRPPPPVTLDPWLVVPRPP